MSFLKSLKQILSPVAPREAGEPQEKEATSSPRQEAGHVVQVQEDVLDALVRDLGALRGKSDVQGIQLWVADSVTAQAIQGKEFNARLRLRLDDAGLEELGRGTIAVRREAAPAGARSLAHGVSLTVGDDEGAAAPQATGRLVVSEVAGHGTLACPRYVLDSGVKSEWHVGRGAQSSRNPHRTNDVVVRDDDDEAVMRQFNAFVSSEQATIVAVAGRFFLQAMPAGCRDAGGCATKIISGEHVRELTDVSRRYRLSDGDLIELGTKVLLAVSLE